MTRVNKKDKYEKIYHMAEAGVNELIERYRAAFGPMYVKHDDFMGAMYDADIRKAVNVLLAHGVNLRASMRVAIPCTLPPELADLCGEQRINPTYIVFNVSSMNQELLARTGPTSRIPYSILPRTEEFHRTFEQHALASVMRDATKMLLAFFTDEGVSPAQTRNYFPVIELLARVGLECRDIFRGKEAFDRVFGAKKGITGSVLALTPEQRLVCKRATPFFTAASLMPKADKAFYGPTPDMDLLEVAVIGPGGAVSAFLPE